MHHESLNPATGLPAALSAFLRGAERRAFVFLWLQSGDAAAAERALAAAIRAFPGPAARMPMAEWPTRFWKLLLALPLEPGTDWPPALAFLAPMRPPVRRALLLRQVAGLDEATAAEVMGVDVDAYRQALADACPRDGTGAPDAAGWRLQAEAIQQAGRDLDPQQLSRLMQLRDAALAGRSVAPAAPAAATTKPAATTRRRSAPRGRRIWIAVAVLAAALVLGLAWWRWPVLPPTPAGAEAEGVAQEDDLRVHDAAPVVVEPLPAAEPPAVAADWPHALSEPPQDPIIAELALLSWYAAGAPDSRLEREGAAGQAVAPPAVADADADANDTLAAAVDAWQQLDALEQAQVHAAAAALRAQEPAAQARLRARFATLDAMERRGWLLGPALGADYAALQPLFGFVAEDERAPLLAALRALTPEQRARLRELSLRTPPAARADLRRELLATPPAQRGAWLEQRGRQ